MASQDVSIGTVAPTAFVDVRLQLHWAAQVVGAASNAVLDSRPDDSQSNMGWASHIDALVSHPLAGGMHAALLFDGPQIALLDGDLNAIDSVRVHGRTMQELMDWLSHVLPEHGIGLPNGGLTLRDYEMPEHPVGSGGAFDLDATEPLAALARWYDVSDAAFKVLAETHAHATSVRCWPHHFDLGLLLPLEPGQDSETGRSIGIGMSPGDGNYAEPYFYVNPYPNPVSPILTLLPSGAVWHTQGWLGAILTGTSLVKLCGSDEVPSPLAFFLESAIVACGSMLPARK